MKLALISTPRSGNTWLRHILASLYQLEQYAVHTPSEFDWAHDRCIVQLHWRHSPEFACLLRGHGFQVVTIARHPLDVLLSILQFAPHEPQTACWLSGAGGTEMAIHHQSPASPEFLDYAIGSRARALLSVTPDWWTKSNAVKIRYEDLVRNPEATVHAFSAFLGPPLVGVNDALQPLNIENLRSTSTNNHFWKGQPGLWREMIPADVARQIEAAHQDIFRCLNYCTK